MPYHTIPYHPTVLNERTYASRVKLAEHSRATLWLGYRRHVGGSLFSKTGDVVADATASLHLHVHPYSVYPKGPNVCIIHLPYRPQLLTYSHKCTRMHPHVPSTGTTPCGAGGHDGSCPECFPP